MRGDGRGRELGFATANLAAGAAHARVPASGIYAGWGHLDGSSHPAAISVGYNPTFSDARDRVRIEAHLLDFDRDVYGRPLRVEFTHRLRGEERFGSVDELVAQVHRDIAAVQRGDSAATRPPSLAQPPGSSRVSASLHAGLDPVAEAPGRSLTSLVPDSPRRSTGRHRRRPRSPAAARRSATAAGSSAGVGARSRSAGRSCRQAAPARREAVPAWDRTSRSSRPRTSSSRLPRGRTGSRPRSTPRA